MNYGDTLLRHILAEPDNDDPRLRYADWLDDQPAEMACERCEAAGMHWLDIACKCGGRNVSTGNAEQAEFIRVQCELARIGEAHIVVTEQCTLIPQYGPDYYTLSGGEETETGRLIFEAKVGRRVDVPNRTNLAGKKVKPLYGLRIHEIRDSEIIVVRDAKSVPWEGEALRRREQELERLSFTDESAVWGSRDSTKERGWLFTRGFVSHVTCTAADWLAHGDAILATQPVQDVNLTTRLYGLTSTPGVLDDLAYCNNRWPGPGVRFHLMSPH